MHASGASVYLVSDQRGYVVPSNNPPVVDMGAYQSSGIFPWPAVTAVTPNTGSGSGGATVTISGSNFTGATAVFFGGTAAASFTVNGAGTQITAITPAEPTGVVDVTVANTYGTLATSSADQYTFVTPIVVSSVSPSSDSTSGGTSVVITGSSFNNITGVFFGGIAASFSVNSTTKITAIDPPHLAGTVDVTVATALTTSATSPADQFTYTAGQPGGDRYQSFLGQHQRRHHGHHHGHNLFGATVSFGTTAASIVSNSPTQIVATSPASPARSM